MKRQRRSIQERAGPPPGYTDSDEEPQQVQRQAPASKRSRMEAVHHSDDSGSGSGSESEEESSSGSEVSFSTAQRPGLGRLPLHFQLLAALRPPPAAHLLLLPALRCLLQGEGGEDEGLPLGQLVALRQDGSTTPAAMKARAQALRQDKSAGRQRFKREGKHRPVEMSSRRPVPVLREALPGGKR